MERKQQRHPDDLGIAEDSALIASLKLIKNIRFTNREIDIMACILSGKAYKRVACLLNISPKTAELHARNVMLRLGCNSREGIIDFIEKSDKFYLLKKHYSNILIKIAFEHELKKLILLTKKETDCFIFYYGMKKTKFSFIPQLTKHLNIAGINAFSKVWEKDKIENYLTDKEGEQQISVIYIISSEFIERLKTIEYEMKKEAFNLTAKFKKQLNSIIFLSLEDQISLSFYENLSDFVCINLVKRGNYYFLFFELLTKLLPTIKLDASILEFKKQYKILQDSFSLQAWSQDNETKTEIVNVKNDKPWKNFILKCLVSCICLVGFSFIIFSINKNIKILNYKPQNSEANIINDEKNELLKPQVVVNLDDNKQTINHLTTWPLQLPSHNDNRFVERKINYIDCMEIIHKTISPDNNQLKTLVIYGLGGVGKTQIAIHYIHNKLAKTYDFKIWFSAETKTMLDHSYIEFAKTLGLIKNYNNSVEYIRNVVLNWFEKNPNWLIVFDNATDYESIHSYLPRTGGSVLITSRHAIWPTSIKTLNISPMQEDEAVRLVQVFSGRKSVYDAKLAKKLGYLPLAIAQAASYMQVYDKTALEYLTLYKRRRYELLGKNLHSYGIGHEPTLVTWNNSLNAINEQAVIKKENLLAKELLIMSAYLAADQIPKIIFTQWIKQNFPNQDVELITDEVIVQLLSHSLITRDSKNFNIHRLLQDIIRNQNKSLETEQKTISNILDVLAQLFIKNTIFTSTLQKNCNLLPHIDAILKHAMKYLDDKHIKLQVARLLNVKAYLYTQTGLTIIQNAEQFSNLAKKYCQELADITDEESNSWLYAKGKISIKTKACAQILYRKLLKANLSKQDRELLPIIYASILYTQGRMYFYDKDLAKLKQSKAYLYLSKNLSELIEQYTNKKIFYKIYAESNGLLYFNNEFGTSKRQLIYNISRYKQLLKETGTYITEDNQKIIMTENKIYKMNCLKEMLRSYAMLASYDHNKRSEGLVFVKKLLKYMPAYTNDLVKASSYYNAIGTFYLAYDNYKEAKLYFEKALVVELSKSDGREKPDHNLADTYYGLARTNFSNNDFVLANNAIDNCLKLRKILYKENDPRLIVANEYKKEISNKLVSKNTRITQSGVLVTRRR